MLFAARRTEVIIDLPPGFTRDAEMGRAQIGLTVHGVLMRAQPQSSAPMPQLS